MERKKTCVLTADFQRMFYDDAQYHEKSPMLLHKHADFMELHYVKEGKESYRVDNRVYDLHPGSVVVLDPDIWHGEEPFREESCETYTCALKNVRIDGKPLERLVKSGERAAVDFEPGSALENVMLALYEIQKEPGAKMADCDRLSDVILTLVYRKMTENGEREDGTVRKNDELVRMITQFLDKNYTEEINLESLSERFGLSVYYLSHIFKNETGVSPMRYVMIRKIGEAQNLLKNTNMSIRAIGERLGFSSNCHLSSAFRKYLGLSPKEYRLHYKDGHEIRDIYQRYQHYDFEFAKKNKQK